LAQPAKFAPAAYRSSSVLPFFDVRRTINPAQT
jgi:hypothetical protein